MGFNLEALERRYSRRQALELFGKSSLGLFLPPVFLSERRSPPRPELPYTPETDRWKTIASYTSDFTNSEDYRKNNIIIGSNALNDWFWYFDANLNKYGKNQIMPGEIFSISSVLGEVTDFVDGKAIGPDLQPITVYGGGICQIPTTMNVASLKSGLYVEERTNHSYYNGWYFGDPNDSKEFGMDATVYIPGVDLIVRNTYDYPIRFFFKIVDEHLRVEVIGPPELKPYYVEPLIPYFDGTVPQLKGENRPVKDAGRYPWAARTIVNQIVWRDPTKQEKIFEKSFKSFYRTSPYR